MKNIVRIKLINQCAGKLQFVKGIKSICTNLGLKEAKDIIDNICTQPFKYVEFEIPNNSSIYDVKSLLDDGLTYLVKMKCLFTTTRSMVEYNGREKQIC